MPPPTQYMVDGAVENKKAIASSSHDPGAGIGQCGERRETGRLVGHGTSGGVEAVWQQ
jgi:hypothetical protein